MAHNGKGLISVFQEFSASINKTVFIKNQICQKQSYLGENFLCVSKKQPKTNLKFF